MTKRIRNTADPRLTRHHLIREIFGVTIKTPSSIGYKKIKERLLEMSRSEHEWTDIHSVRVLLDLAEGKIQSATDDLIDMEHVYTGLIIAMDAVFRMYPWIEDFRKREAAKERQRRSVEARSTNSLTKNRLIGRYLREHKKSKGITKALIDASSTFEVPLGTLKDNRRKGAFGEDLRPSRRKHRPGK